MTYRVAAVFGVLAQRRALLGSIALVAALALLAARLAGVQGAAVVTTDKPDYYSYQTATITGSGFAASTSYDIPVIRPAPSPMVKGDGVTPGWDTVVTNGSGAFTYYYTLDGVPGIYEVRVYNSPWSGNLADAPLASTTFMDADIDFSQCRNDSGVNGTANDEILDDCEWTSGAINQSDSVYAEGDSVPQRLFHNVSDGAGTYVMGFEYEFSKADTYAYDFLTNVDGTMAVGPLVGSDLNQCGNLPGFVSAATCASLFVAPNAAVPSDPFDSVSSTENPPGAAARQFRVGCSPACSSISVAFPSLDSAGADA
ncbi:MAG TPA: hypothetical protein VFT91_06665, partial [Dehalococcoidia bacterium]|nr:hypothetical protein [Dehalococcoidia bacterium]